MQQTCAPGLKSRAELTEEAHPLMLASSFRQSTIDMPAGFVPTSATLTKWIQDTNAAAGGASPAISLWKADATEILVMRMPEKTFNCIFQHYRKFSWERCCLNTKMLRMAVWGPGHVVTHNKVTPQAPWLVAYTQSAESVHRLAETLIADWEHRFTPQSAFATQIRDVQVCRVRDTLE